MTFVRVRFRSFIGETLAVRNWLDCDIKVIAIDFTSQRMKTAMTIQSASRPMSIRTDDDPTETPARAPSSEKGSCAVHQCGTLPRVPSRNSPQVGTQPRRCCVDRPVCGSDNLAVRIANSTARSVTAHPTADGAKGCAACATKHPSALYFCARSEQNYEHICCASLSEDRGRVARKNRGSNRKSWPQFRDSEKRASARSDRRE